MRRPDRGSPRPADPTQTSEAGVVDQQIDGPVTEFTQHRQDAVAGGQVGGEEGDRAVSGISDDALADLFKPVRVPAGE